MKDIRIPCTMSFLRAELHMVSNLRQTFCDIHLHHKLTMQNYVISESNIQIDTKELACKIGLIKF